MTSGSSQVVSLAEAFACHFLEVDTNLTFESGGTLTVGGQILVGHGQAPGTSLNLGGPTNLISEGTTVTEFGSMSLDKGALHTTQSFSMNNGSAVQSVLSLRVAGGSILRCAPSSGLSGTFGTSSANPSINRDKLIDVQGGSRILANYVGFRSESEGPPIQNLVRVGTESGSTFASYIEVTPDPDGASPFAAVANEGNPVHLILGANSQVRVGDLTGVTGPAKTVLCGTNSMFSGHWQIDGSLEFFGTSSFFTPKDLVPTPTTAPAVAVTESFRLGNSAFMSVSLNEPLPIVTAGDVVFGERADSSPEGGTLLVSEAPADAPVGTRFRLIETNGGVVRGKLGSVLAPALPDGKQFAVDYGPDYVDLVVVDLRVTFHRLTVESNLAANPTFSGSGEPPPIELKANAASVAALPEVSRGVIADGVTPLALLLTPNPPINGQVVLACSVASGFFAEGKSVDTHIKRWRNNAWADSGDTIDLVNGVGLAYITGIKCEDLVTPSVTVQASYSQSGSEVGKGKFEIAKPPVALVHGYKSDNHSWQPAFLQPLMDNRVEGFVVPVEYGVAPFAAVSSKQDNTYGTLETLSDLLSKALTDHFESKFEQAWAMTRYQIIGHSQGGVLARMLSTTTSPNGLPKFRSSSNFERGRFERTVTIGSPHNGARLLRYVLGQTVNHDTALVSIGSTLTESLLQRFGAGGILDSAIATLKTLAPFAGRIALEEGFVQPKFDPWGEEMTNLHESGEWPVDPTARFHFVRTVVNDGVSPPEAPLGVPAWLILNLTDGDRGHTVLPLGSDGITDLQSAQAGALAPQVTTVLTPNIAHVGRPSSLLWAALHGETSVAETALASLDALDGQTPSGAFIAPFRGPAFQEDKAKIDQLGFGPAHVDLITKEINAGTRLMESAGAVSSTTVIKQFQLTPSGGFALQGIPAWSADIVGGAAGDEETLTVTPDPNNPLKVTVTYGSTVLGDVILRCCYRATNGTTVYGMPIRISPEPVASLTGITLTLPTVPVTVGANVSPQLFGAFSDGTQREIFVEAFAADYISSDPAVVDSAFGLSFRAVSPGTSTLKIDYKGLHAEATLTVASTTTTTATKLLNISTRMEVLTGDNVLIGGFIVSGTDLKKVIIRGIGPSLPVSGKLQDTTLELHDSTGALIASNDDWKEHQAEVEATTVPPSNDAESAIVAVLPANNAAYTAILRGKNDSTGIGLVEVYDLDQAANSKLANISTRGFIDTGDNVMIGGLIVGGGDSAKVIVRAIGPSLPVAGNLADPTLELHNGDGSLLASNDNWRSDQEAEIIATTVPPSNNAESAIVRTLMPGNYTAIVRGVNNTTGVGLVEVYNLQ
jgi:hypothetical protein